MTKYQQLGINVRQINRGVYKGSLELCYLQLTSLAVLKELLIHTIEGDLYCNHNSISSLEHCPVVLGSLFCSNNLLTELQHCNEVHKVIDCRYNRITTLEHLPRMVKGVYCNGNKITDIPENFPESVVTFACDDIVREGYVYRRMKALEDF